MEEQLIEAVRAFPILYDTSHPDYFRAKLKQDLWESIAKDLNLHNGKYLIESLLFLVSFYSCLYL